MSGVPGVPSLTGPFPVGVGVGTGVGNGAGTGAGHGSGTGAGTGAGATSSMVVLSTSSTGGELLPSGGLAGDAENQGQTRLSGSSPPQAHGSASSPQIPITTHVGVASDPIPQPPRRKGAAAWVAGGVLLCGLGALGLTHLFGRESGGSTYGNSTDAASPAARSSVELGELRRSQAAAIGAPSGEVPPPGASGAPSTPDVAPVRPAAAPPLPAAASPASSASASPAKPTRTPAPKAPQPGSAPPRSPSTSGPSPSRQPSGID